MDWDAVVDDLGPRLYRYFRANFTVPAAEDLVQITLLRLVEKVESGRFKAARGNLSMYAFGIAHFSALEYRRRNDQPIDANFNEAEQAADAADPHQSITHQALRKAVGRLEEPQRQVLGLLIDQDLTLPEIALILDLPVNTVKSHVHRAKAALARTLGVPDEP